MAAAAAAIANAFFDATGRRMRRYPLLPARVLQALSASSATSPATAPGSAPAASRRDGLSQFGDRVPGPDEPGYLRPDHHQPPTGAT